jgi:hypothetical protein
MPSRSSARLNEALAALDAARARQEVGRELDLFGPPADLAPVARAIESVTEHAGPEWRYEALAVVERAARAQSELTVEDIAPHVPPTIDRRALGGVMVEAKRRGWLEPLGYVSSGAERHHKPIRLWRSRIHRVEAG